MKRRKLSYTKPLFDIETGEEVKVYHRFSNGNLVIGNPSKSVAGTVDAYGVGLFTKRKRITDSDPVTVEYLTLYPTGQVYSKQCCPVQTSSYGVENLIQIKITKRGDKIVKKEFV